MMRSDRHRILARHVSGASVHQAERVLADEVAIALSYGGTTHAVMMATPCDLHDFAIGFSLSEGLIAHVSEIEDITLQPLELGIDIQIVLSQRQRDAVELAQAKARQG